MYIKFNTADWFFILSWAELNWTVVITDLQVSTSANLWWTFCSSSEVRKFSDLRTATRISLHVVSLPMPEIHFWLEPILKGISRDSMSLCCGAGRVYPITTVSVLGRGESQTPTETDSNLWGGQSYKLRRQPSLGLEQVPETPSQPGSCCSNCTDNVCYTAIISIISQPPPLPPHTCLAHWPDFLHFTHLTIPVRLS